MNRQQEEIMNIHKEIRKEYKKDIERLKKENEQLKQAIAFARQYYHLSQEVYDVFNHLVDSSYDDKIRRKDFLNSLEGFEYRPYGESE